VALLQAPVPCALVCAYQPGCAPPPVAPTLPTAAPRPARACVRVSTPVGHCSRAPVCRRTRRPALLPPRLDPDDARALLPSVPMQAARTGRAVRVVEYDTPVPCAILAATPCSLRSSVRHAPVRKGPPVRAVARTAWVACGPGAPAFSSLHGCTGARSARCGTADGDGLRGPCDGFVPHGRGHGGRA